MASVQLCIANTLYGWLLYCIPFSFWTTLWKIVHAAPVMSVVALNIFILQLELSLTDTIQLGEQDLLLGNVLHAHIAEVCIHRYAGNTLLHRAVCLTKVALVI